MRRHVNLRLAAVTTFAACAAPESVGVIANEVQVCPAGETTPGVDVSSWQGTIDWNAVKDSGITFAFVRVSDGLGSIDGDFEANWAGTREVGIVRGAYQFFRPNQDAIDQAQLLLDRMGPLESGDLPPVIDVEDAGSASPAGVATKVQAWLDHVEAALGVRPIIYTGKYFWQDNVDGGGFGEYPLWIANWDVSCPNLPAPWTDWAFHQNSDNGSVPGIEGNVDTDVWNGSLAELMAYGVAPACGDGVCNGAETSDTCVDDCPRCEPIPAAGRIIDDDEPCFVAGGPTAGLRRVADAGYQGGLIWTFTTDDPDEANFAEWALTFEEAGRYKLEAYTAAAYAGSRAAGYAVRHGETTEVASVDQTAVDGWSTVGEFDFAAGGGQSVHVADNTGEPRAGETRLVFDALRLSRIGQPPTEQPDAGPGTDAGPESAAESGCACSLGRGPMTQPTGWAVIAVLAVAACRRRRRD